MSDSSGEDPPLAGEITDVSRPAATLVIAVEAWVVEGPLEPRHLDAAPGETVLSVPLAAHERVRLSDLSALDVRATFELPEGWTESNPELCFLARVERPPRSAEASPMSTQSWGPDAAAPTRVLGAGSESLLERASDPETGAPVVLKSLLPEAASRPGLRARFVEEAALGLEIAHPNVVRVLQSGERDGVPFVVREWVQGANLRRLSGGARRLSPLALGWIAEQAAAALEYAHGLLDAAGAPRGVIHGELCPSTILVERGGRVKLSDLGLAALDGQVLSARLGARRGRFGYRAPEQLRGRPPGPASDLFALGVVLTEALSGLPLMLDGTLWLDELEDTVRARAALVPATPPELTELLVQLTRLAPADRPGAAEARGRFEQIRASLGAPEAAAAEIDALLDEALLFDEHGMEEVGPEDVFAVMPEISAPPFVQAARPSWEPEPFPAPSEDDGVFLLTERKPRPEASRVIVFMLAGAAAAAVFGWWLTRT